MTLIARVLMLLSNGFDPDPRVLAESRALEAAGHSVTIVAWDRDRALPEVECRGRNRVERIRVASTHGRGRGQAPFLGLFWARAAARALRSTFDAVWCHDLDTLPAGWALSRLRRVPVVYDAHESYPDMVEASLGPRAAQVLSRIERFFVPRVSAVVTVGERLARRYQALGAGRVRIAGNWKDQTTFTLAPDARSRIRAGLGISEDAFLVSDIGWLGEERQVAPFLSAVQRSPEVFALIGGRGPLSDRCREAQAVSPRIRYLGWVDGDRVPELTAASDAVFYGFDPANGNARYSAPNKLFEAIAAGIPVLTGPFGEIERIVREERIGVVLPDYSADAIARGLREALVHRVPARRFARARRRYSRTRADAVVRAILEEVLRAEIGPAASPAPVPSCR